MGIGLQAPIRTDPASEVDQVRAEFVVGDVHNGDVLTACSAQCRILMADEDPVSGAVDGDAYCLGATIGDSRVCGEGVLGCLVAGSAVSNEVPIAHQELVRWGLT